MQVAKSNTVPFGLSTDSIPPKDRVAVVREVLGRLQLLVELEPLGNEPLRLNIAAPMRISDIASDIGFADISTFNRAFKRRFGDTPGAVRQSHRAQ